MGGERPQYIKHVIKRMEPDLIRAHQPARRMREDLEYYMENLNVKRRESAAADVLGHESQSRPDQPKDTGLFATGLRQVRRVVVLFVGGIILLVGVIMLVTPGPGLVAIPLGLGILSIEFSWARSLLHRFREKYMHARGAFRGRRPGGGAVGDLKRKQ